MVLMVIMIPLGIGLTLATYNVENLTIDYSRCDSLANEDLFTDIPKRYYSRHFKASTSSDTYQEPRWRVTRGTDSDGDETTTCTVQFDIPGDISAPLYLYYKLTNFYQNHREYVESYDWDQLQGQLVALNSIDDDCKPLKSIDDRVIYPCGLVANSLFNDTISNLTSTEGETTYEFSNRDIAWGSDKNLYKRTQYNPEDIVPPPNWLKRYPDGYTAENLPDLSQDEFFMNWMRTAALPSFMKLALKNTDTTLSAGTYSLDVEMNYPVTIFGGTKSIVITTNSVIGGRNLSLGICYLIVGGLCLTFFIVFLLKQLIHPRKVGSHSMNSVKFGESEYHVHDGSDRDVL